MFKSFAFDLNYPLFSQGNISLVYRSLQTAGKNYFKIIRLGYGKKNSSTEEKDEYINEFINVATDFYYLQWMYEKSIDLNIQILNGRPFKEAYLEWEEFTFIKNYKREIAKKIEAECKKYKDFEGFISVQLSTEHHKTKLYLEGIER